MNRIYSIKNAMLLKFVFAAVFPFLLVNLPLIYYHAKQTEKNVVKENSLLARSVAEAVQLQLDEPLNLLKNFAELVADKTVSGDPVIDSFLDSAVRNHPIFETIFILDSHGRVTNAGVSESYQRSRQDLLGMDMSRQDFFREANKRGMHFWSTTFMSMATGNPTMTLSFPYQGGVIAGNINLGELSNILGKIRTGIRAHIAIVNREGRVIAHHDRKQVQQQASLKYLEIVRDGLRGKNRTLRYESDDVEKLGSSVAIPETGWAVVSERDAAVAFADVTKFKIIFSCGLLVTIVLAVLIARRSFGHLLLPLMALISGASKVAQGNFALELPASTYKEVDELSVQFGVMARAVQDREDALAERNEELASIEEELRQQIDEYIRSQHALIDSEERLLGALTSVEQSRDFYLKLFEEFPLLIWRAGPDGKCNYFNRTWLDFTGRSLEQELGDGWVDGVHPDDLERCVTTYLSAFHARRSFEMEYRLLHNEDDYRLILDCGRPFYDLEGIFSGYIGTCVDISERRSLEERLQQKQKMESIGTLAGGVAHDFNNILTVIAGCGAMLRMQMNDGAPMLEYVRMIEESAERAAQLTRSLLSFSRKQVLHPRQMSLNEIVEKLRDFLQRVIGEDISLFFNLGEENLNFMADPNQIELLIINLVTNARDAVAPGGTIAISTGIEVPSRRLGETNPCCDESPCVRLSVADTGVGMDEATRKKIFEPFFTTKKVGKGTGLGLSLVYGVVSQHNGLIDVQSEPGKGTMVSVFFPRADGETTVQETEKVDLACADATILLVEDEDAVRKITRKMLEQFGFTVIEAANGEDAVDIFKERADRIDLVLLDVIMPYKNGLEAYEEMKVVREDLKAIFMSGYTADILEARVANELTNVLTKPVTPDTLLKMIRQTLR